MSFYVNCNGFERYDTPAFRPDTAPYYGVSTRTKSSEMATLMLSPDANDGRTDDGTVCWAPGVGNFFAEGGQFLWEGVSTNYATDNHNRTMAKYKLAWDETRESWKK